MGNQAAIPVDLEAAFHFIVRYLREGRRGEFSDYGYGFYLPNVMRDYVREVGGISQSHERERYLEGVSPAFYAAAWELCRRGILRPGLVRYGGQSTEDGASGNGYTVTPAGGEWLQQAGQYDYVPTEPTRFARVLDTFTSRFGPGYRERSQEAVRCYGAHAYVASCAMCGAAAESIMLALAIARTGDEEFVLKTYLSSGGRSRIESQILGQQPDSVKEEFRGYTSLLKYWRDAASHGRATQIGENEAFTSLALVLRFAQFVDGRWTDLISPGSP